MSFWDIAILGSVAIYCAYVLFTKKGHGCSGNCSGCSGCAHKEKCKSYSNE